MIDEYFSLSIGFFEIDWGKNFHGRNDFSALFNPSDFKVVKYYDDDDWEQPVYQLGNGYCKKLEEIIPLFV